MLHHTCCNAKMLENTFTSVYKEAMVRVLETFYTTHRMMTKLCKHVHDTKFKINKLSLTTTIMPHHHMKIGSFVENSHLLGHLCLPILCLYPLKPFAQHMLFDIPLTNHLPLGIGLDSKQANCQACGAITIT